MKRGLTAFWLIGMIKREPMKRGVSGQIDSDIYLGGDRQHPQSIEIAEKFFRSPKMVRKE